MAGDDAWLRAEMGGTTRATVISKPEVLVALLKKAKRPLFIIGHEVTAAGPESEALTEFIEGVARAKRVPVLGTSHMIRDLIARGIKASAIMGGMEIVDRLRDPDWKGLDGHGQYDLVLIAGMSYSLGWVLLSGLRHGAPGLKTIALDRMYQPNASWSFSNQPVGPWRVSLQAVLALLEKG
ncbi:MAG TPA: CO dehydrogenase/acetyl-CoA synthase complex subunit epsilon [Methanospirillum sp.]|nr:CO dehydrogenase/acetyl-CoA synthase complex subunit epsilon [Methanospirillum sp.]